MNKTIPSKETIEELAEAIRARDIVYLARLSDTFNKYLDAIMRVDKDNRIEWAILSLLIVRGGSATPTQLARFTFRAKHSITRFINNLERDGFVLRTHGEKDRRTIKIEITKLGLERVQSSINRLDERWQPVFNQLTKDERDLYLNITRKLQGMILKEIPNIGKPQDIRPLPQKNDKTF